MNLGVWHSNKSLTMQEVRVLLKKKSEKGGCPIPKKEANRIWREDILGILSEDQRRQKKVERQQGNKATRALNSNLISLINISSGDQAQVEIIKIAINCQTAGNPFKNSRT